MAMRVFISPSNQPRNRCVQGPHSEKAHCEALAKIMIPLLKAEGIEVKQRDTSRSMASAVRLATAWKAHLYLPIHTNASSFKKTRGTRFGRFTGRADSLFACDIFKRNWQKIYTFPTLVKHSIYHFLEAWMPKCASVYCELVFHSNKEDADWFHKNMTEIAMNLVASIVQYRSTLPKKGQATVVTAGANTLGLWDSMSKEHRIMYVPRGAAVTVLEQFGAKWVKIKYGSVIGYVDRKYLKMGEFA